MKYFTILTCMALCAMLSCSSEDPVAPDVPTGPEEGDTKLSLNITFPSEGTLTSRALTDTDEKNIKNLRIFVFAGSGTDQTAGKLLYEVESVPVPTGTGDIKTTTVTMRKMSQKQRLVLVANMPSDISATIPTSGQEGKSLSELFTGKDFSASSWRKNSLSSSDPGFPMWGQMKDSITINESTGAITVNMFRAMARVDVGVDMDNTTSALAGDFKINEVYVCNAADKGYLTPHSDYMKESGIDAVIISKPQPHASRHAEQVYTISGQRTLMGAIYIPESDVKDSPSGNTPAFLVVKATYKGQADCYYRIDFANSGSFIPVARNHAYRINITNVKSYGYGSLADAKDAEPSIIGKDLIVEDVNSEINEIAYNDTDMFGISASEVLFDWDKMLVGNILETGATKEQYELRLYTTYASWTATIDGSPSWFRLVNGSEMTSVTKNPAAGTLSSLIIRVKEENLTGTEREGGITLKSGLLTLTVKIRQSGGANSHLIRFEAGATSAQIKLPVPFAREALGGGAISPTAARVLWYETKESAPVTFAATLSGNYVTVTATSNGTQFNGNAVIALVQGSGIGWVGSDTPMETIWSWHVWTMAGSTDMDTKYHDPNRSRLMGSVLGKYTANKGLFYQWGRKDPFPQHTTDVSPRVVAVEATTTDNTAAYVIQNPTVFYTGTHWLTGTVPATRWTAGSKAEYNDPCPTGWRVPEDNDKYEWNLPATISDFQNGLLSGTTGSWASSSHYLWITPGTAYSCWTASGTTVTAANITSSTPGANIRCIKDIKLVK